jgi:HK97 gp10 family phage protein
MAVEGINEVIKALAEAVPTGDEVQSVLKVQADFLIAKIKEKVPVDSGNLKDSIQFFKPKKKNYLVVGPKYRKGSKGFKRKGAKSGGNHANLVEYGFTHKSGKVIPPRPFMRPAFDTNKEAILNMMEKKLGDLVVKKFA